MAINMFKWKRKEAVVFDVIFRLIVNYSEKNCSSRGEPTDVFKYAAVPLCRITGLASNLRNPNYRNLRTWYWEMCRPMSPDYLPNLHGTLDRDGNADSNRSAGKMFLGQIVPGSVEKHLMKQANIPFSSYALYIITWEMHKHVFHFSISWLSFYIVLPLYYS